MLCVKFLYVVAVALLAKALNCQAQSPDELMKCVSSGEPHIVQWHPVSNKYPGGVTCTGNNMFKLVHNRYIEFDIKVIRGYGVDVTATFLNGQHIPICTAKTNNYTLYTAPYCKQYNVIATLTDTPLGQALTIKHEAAKFLAIVTHIRKPPLQYTIEIWQPNLLVGESKGQCSVKHCNPTRSIPDEPLQPKPRQVISPEMAQQICQVHLSHYTPQLRTKPNQRSAYYNQTVQRLFGDCVFDVQITGEAAAAAKSFEPLVIDDLVEGATDIDQIESMFNSGSTNTIDTFSINTDVALVEVHDLFPRLQSNYYKNVNELRIGRH